MSTLGPRDPEWRWSLPRLQRPLPGESLLSFVLRVDRANGLPAGATLAGVRVHRTHIAQLASPGSLLLCGSLDLDALAHRLVLSRAALERLTAIPLRRGLFGLSVVRSRTFGQRRRWRICPACAAAGDLPLVHLIDGPEVCARHAMLLAQGCRCSAPIAPLRGQVPFSCHRCRLPYAQILTRVAAPGVRADMARRIRIREGLLEHQFAPAPTAMVREALRSLLLLSDRRPRSIALDRLHHRLTKGTPSIALICSVLEATDASVADFARILVDVHHTRTQVRAAVPGCPNPACELYQRETAARGPVRLCTRCGTRYTRTRTLFSFDVQPGYAVWRARRNARALDMLRARVIVACGLLERRGLLSIHRAFALARVPATPSYRSERAGLVAVVLGPRRRFVGRRRRAA